jgi:hypothetical protein
MSHLYPAPVGTLAAVGDPTAAGEVYIATAANTLALQSGATLRSSLGLAIGSDVQAWDADLDTLAGLDSSDDNFIVGSGSGWVVESGATARASLGLTIGTDVQAYSAALDVLAGLPFTADGEFIVGTGAGTAQLESGNTARTSLGLGTGDSPTFTDLNLSGDAVINGDLTVKGTTTTVHSETVLLNDNYLDLNTGYTADTAQSGGIVVNYDPTTTADTSTTGGFATTSTVITAGSGTFSPGDIIAIWDADNPDNNGYFEVVTHTGTTLTIDSTPQEDWSKSAFVVDTGDTDANITKVGVSVIRTNTSGDWEVGKGNTVPLSYSGITAGLLSSNNTWTGTQDFTNTITTDAVQRNIRLISSSVGANASDHVVVQNGGASITYTLPAATGSGRELVIKKMTSTGSGNLTVDGSGAETIDGSTTVVLNRQYESITIYDYDSGVWMIA